MAAETLEETDYEVLSPPNDLRKKVRVLNKRESAKFDPVKAAEAALQRISKNFDGWMKTEAMELVTIFEAIKENGIDAERLDALFQSVHNLKGQAVTLGYPLIGSVAASFCQLIEHVPAPDALPLALAEQYVIAIRAMVTEDARSMDNETGAALLNKLSEVTDGYLAQFNADHSSGDAL